MTEVPVRKGQAGAKLDREAFGARYRERFVDPAFDGERDAIARLEAIAFEAYAGGQKAPRTRPAGEGFADPTYELSLDWLEARDAIARAAERQADPAAPSRVLVVLGGSRDDGSCAGEMGKTYRLAGIVREVLEAERFEVDVLDLAKLVSEPLLAIHPCKACVSTAMTLCHFPCSCYPNHATGQTNDAMADVYARFAAAHGVVVVTPVYWGAPPSGLKALMDRLVCADGGNPDPTTTQGKKAALAKALEPTWTYPKHFAGRVFGVVAHADAEGVEDVTSVIAGWLETSGLVRAGKLATVGRYIGYYEEYATSHLALDRDVGFQEETRNVARTVRDAVRAMRAGTLVQPGDGLREPRPK